MILKTARKGRKRNFPKIKTENSEKTPHTSPYRVSWGVSPLSSLQKIHNEISRVHCTWSWKSENHYDADHTFTTRVSAVREITKSSSTFSATNISINIVLLLRLHDTIQTKSQFGTKFSSIYLANWEKRLVFRPSFVNVQRAKDGIHMFDAKYRYVFVV